MNKKRWFASVAATIGAAVLGTSLSLASTGSIGQVTIKHNAYLRSGPNIHDYAIKLETVGNVLTLESGSTQYWWHVQDAQGKTGYVIRLPYWTSVSYGSPAASTPTFQLPPGVTYDANVGPIAPLSADYQTKFNAVMQVANSKLGTPYIWGHNEDRGQYGFDCSNFTAYVYHHALGYHMSGASLTQYHSVGWPISVSSMRPGDLVIFNSGGHVGIYAGNGQMIQEGGGLGKVGYLKLSPGSYWYNHITTVKRMF